MSGTRLPRRLVTGFLAVAMLLPTALAAGNISGQFRAEGRNPDGSSYEGKVEIGMLGDTVAVAWQVGAKGYTGNGILDGRVLTVNWGDKFPVVYVIMPDGSLHGTWGDGRALERLTPLDN